MLPAPNKSLTKPCRLVGSLSLNRLARGRAAKRCWFLLPPDSPVCGPKRSPIPRQRRSNIGTARPVSLSRMATAELSLLQQQLSPSRSGRVDATIVQVRSIRGSYDLLFEALFTADVRPST